MHIYRWWPPVPVHLKLSLSALVILVVVGTIGYTILEGWPMSTSLFMTIITLTTIGYGIPHELSVYGEWFTISFIFFSFVTYAAVASSLGSFVLSSEFQQAFRQHRFLRRIRNMKNHVIICGYGRIGLLIQQELETTIKNYVIIEKNIDVVEKLRAKDVPVIHGDATIEEVLLQAGVERARALVAVTARDADNAFITLTARSLNPSLFIISRVTEPEIEPQMIRAGADRAICPYRIGAMRIAQILTRPSVHEFIEIVSGKRHLELVLEEIHVLKNSPAIGKTIAELDIRRQFGILIIGVVYREGEQILFNPPSDRPLEKGSILLALGKSEQIDAFRTFIQP